MLSHTVEIDTSERPSRLRFAPNFNVAVPFIDRHISEGRAAKIAIRTSDSAIRYADLAANVDRCAAWTGCCQGGIDSILRQRRLKS